MKKLILSKNDLNNLQKLPLVEGTVEKESTMYYVPNNEKEIIKVYNNFDDKLYLLEKLKTIRNLLSYK